MMQEVMILAPEMRRIEALILIMKQVTILTTDIQIVSTMDVSKQNDTYNINETLIPSSLNVAAISWLHSSISHLEARIFVLRTIFNLILEKFPSLRLWCVVGDSAWQSDTKIIRHKKLFKRLKARGVEIAHADNFAEEMVEVDGKLKFFGAAQLSELAIKSVVRLMTEESCSYIVAVPTEYEINALISKGWDCSEVIDSDLLGRIVENKGLVFKVIGIFDDPESGYVGLGSPSMVRKLAQ